MPVKVAKNIYRLDVPLKGNPLKNLNSFFITGDKNLLIDTGFRTEECREAMYSELRTLGVSLDDTDIFLTHLHSDHSGLAPELHRQGRSIFISRPDMERMHRYITGEAWKLSDDIFSKHGFPDDKLMELRQVNPARIYAPELFDGYTIISEGQVFEYGGYSFQAVSTPGHTPGHMCLFDPGSGIIILGDCVLFDITPNITVWMGFDNSLGAYLGSLNKLKGYGVTQPLAAHRACEGDLNKRIDAIIEHHGKRLDECLNIVRSGGAELAYDIAGKMTWSIRCTGWEDFPTAQKWFAVGETIAHLDYLISEGLVERTDEDGHIRHYAV